MGQSAQILHKIHGCLRSQQELGKIKLFFKQSEITAQLEKCRVELQDALEILRLNIAGKVPATIWELGADNQRRHEKVLMMLETYTNSEYSCSIQSHNSSSTSLLLLLPAYPKIFHGRQTEVMKVTEALMTHPTPVAILGPGGIGKTTLAIAILHHPNVVSKYAQRYYVPCEAAATADQLHNTVAFYLGLEPSQKPHNVIIQHLQEQDIPTLLILDNLETAWEPIVSRYEVEQFLALLSSIEQLALLVGIIPLVFN
ncbi:NB-ARC domain-containing protein [Mycena venus]|uniref:NB-ARC domain-containing protein n=1 Tax=Mycena venus TaxID=2733690 RepID=A0A8H6YZW5_9AGAR|nr:NB-ARC domain-containing protein [Mycena venus]